MTDMQIQTFQTIGSPSCTMSAVEDIVPGGMHGRRYRLDRILTDSKAILYHQHQQQQQRLSRTCARPTILALLDISQFLEVNMAYSSPLLAIG